MISAPSIEEWAMTYRGLVEEFPELRSHSEGVALALWVLGEDATARDADVRALAKVLKLAVVGSDLGTARKILDSKKKAPFLPEGDPGEPVEFLGGKLVLHELPTLPIPDALEKELEGCRYRDRWTKRAIAYLHACGWLSSGRPGLVDKPLAVLGTELGRIAAQGFGALLERRLEEAAEWNADASTEKRVPMRGAGSVLQWLRAVGLGLPVQEESQPRFRPGRPMVARLEVSDGSTLKFDITSGKVLPDKGRATTEEGQVPHEKGTSSTPSALRDEFEQATLGARVESLKSRLVPTVTNQDIADLEAVIREAQQYPPDDRTGFVHNVRRMLEAGGLRLEIVGVSAAVNLSVRNGSLAFVVARQGGRSFKNTTVRVVRAEVPEFAPRPSRGGSEPSSEPK